MLRVRGLMPKKPVVPQDTGGAAGQGPGSTGVTPRARRNKKDNGQPQERPEDAIAKLAKRYILPFQKGSAPPRPVDGLFTRETMVGGRAGQWWGEGYYNLFRQGGM